MAYGFQLGFSIPEINLNPPEQIPGYPHAPLNQGYDPGHWIQDVGPCPSFAEQPPLGYGGDTYTGRTMPAPWPYGFHSANWLEEQQSWRPELPPQPPDDGTLQLAANEQQGFGAPGIGFETFGSPWLNECCAPCPVTGWEFQDNTSTSPCYSFDVQTFSQIPDKRRCSLYHKVSGDVAAGTAWQGKPRSQSLCIPTSEHGFLSQPFTGPESATWSPVNPERSIEEREFQIQLVEPETSSNKELTDFWDSVKFIRSKYPATDPVANSGRIWSIAIRYPNQTAGNSEVTVTVYGDSLLQPVICTQRGCALVQDMMADVVHQIPLHPLAVEPLLSVCGYDECLQNGFTLKSHWRLKREKFLRLRLHCTAGPLLARTCEDDQQELHLDDFLEHSAYWKGMKDRLFRAVANYKEQVKRLLYSETHVNHVMEAVKEVCYTLCSVETQEIRDAISALYGSCLRSAQSWQPSATNTARAEVQSVVMQLSKALSNLINIFSRSFHTEFLAAPSTGQSSPDPHTEPHFTFHLYAAHNLQSSWLRSSDIFFVCCSLIYAGRKICQEIKSTSKPSIQALFSMVIFNEWITFPVPLQCLPYESMLFVKLCGVSESSPHPTTLAWTCAPLYSRQRFVHGPVLLNMVSHLEPPPVITPGALDILLPTLVTLQVDFLERNLRFTEHEPGADSYHNQTSHEDPMNRLEVLAHRHSVLLLSEADKHCMWRYRSGCNTQRNILPLVLGSAPGWDPDSISSMLTILRTWTFHDPLEALGLLNPCFSDQNIRETACQQIGNLSNDELFQYLPQLIQALKFEWSVDNPLMRLLLERSLQSIQIAHRLYWLLTDALNQAHYRGLYKKYLSALQHCAGKALNEEFIKQKKLMKILQEIAEKVRSAQDVKRQEILQGNLAQLEHIFQEVHICRLPQDPAIVVKGINPTSCSYFKSNASPLKISFVNADPLGKNINVIFKAGDDLRQDMLVLQIIEIMDRIWLQEGLDLRMITYRCLSTGTKQGLVQMVPHATTLAKIHQRSGILGPLKDGTIKKWFGSDKSREASDNFLYSCAGWCVVTFILGVCDRHNDNIMITDTGHVFHIDFGKFLGHSQKFGSIKRDRVPFIFTTEMEHFITEGGKYPQRSQEFVELCCRAYNILRRHSRVLINLMELMLQAGLPELCDVEDLRYMHNNLRPQDSDLQATSYFTRKIEESLQCLPVKLNNMIHILANMSLSDTAKSASQMNPPSVSPKNLIRKAAAAGMRKIHEKSGRILHLMTDERLYPDRPSGSQRSPGVQLHISYSKPKLSILLKHLKNVHLPDGSSPTAAAEMSLLRLPNEKMEKKIKAKTKSANPTFNEIVEFYVQELDGYVLNVVVKSKGTFVAAVNIRLDTVTLNKDVWYPLGRSMH